MLIQSQPNLSYKRSSWSLEDLPLPPKGKKGWPWTVATKPFPSHQADGSEWPLISIVTPSYNQGTYLEATLRSVLLQGYPNLEYLVIDGGSSDQSVEIIRKYQKFFTYWISERDQGQTDAINKGLLRTSGEILGWINSDDVYVKGAFHKIVETFLETPESIVVHGDRILIDAQDRVFGCTVLPAFNPPHTGFIVCSETAFWRRSAMDKSGMLNSNLNFAMDLEFFSRLFLQGKFTKLNHYIGYFRCHAASKSSTIWHVAKEESVQIWKSLFKSEWKEEIFYTDRGKILQEFCKHPLLLGFPYIQTKIENIFFNVKS